MKRLKPAFAVCAACVVALGVFAGGKVSTGLEAEGWPATRCAVIDIVRIFNEFQQTKDLNEMLAKSAEQLQEQIAEKRKTLDMKRSELQAFTPDSPDYANRYKELMQQDIEFRTWGTFMQAQVEAENRVWLKRTYQQTVEAAGQVATERGIDVVMYVDLPRIEADSRAGMEEQVHRRKVVWSAKHLDITDMVLQRLNNDYQTRGGRASIKLPF